MIKRMSHILFAALLAAIILVETFGVYISQETCIPCGGKNIAIELISYNDSNYIENCCSSFEKNCSSEFKKCCHNKNKHEHKKEHEYLSLTPVFFQKYIVQINLNDWVTLEFKLHTTVSDNEPTAIYIAHNNNHKNKQTISDYRAFLCTYII